MAIIDQSQPHATPGYYDNLLIYYLNGQLIARSQPKHYKKRKK
jgi:hypothetical protein